METYKEDDFGKPFCQNESEPDGDKNLQILGLVKITQVINLNDKHGIVTRPQLIYVNNKCSMIYFNHNHTVVE